MRLKKSDREKYLRIIRAKQNSKVIAFQKDVDLDYAWMMLTHDHYARLRLDLDHIGRIPLSDKISKDVIGHDPTYKDYIHRYSDDGLWLMAEYVNAADRALQYLRKLLNEETQKRSRSI